MKNILFLFLILISECAVGQKLRKKDKVIIGNLKTEIYYLASDKLEGRRTGTPGEKLAYEYITSQFKNIGLFPKGDNGTYIQPFEVDEGKQILPETYLKIEGNKLEPGKDFFPFVFSGNGKAAANTSPAFNEKGKPWFLDLKESLEDNKNNPHYDPKEFIRDQALEFEKRGASACIVYNSGNTDDGLKFDAKSKTAVLKIPVVYVFHDVAKKYLSDNSVNLNIDLKTALNEKVSTGHNVIGYIDNRAPTTVVIGGHYDHLGYGLDHNSLWTGKPEIHNGADDNASGTALVIEMARMLKGSRLKKNNYLFICFSGEELGLYGSKYFTEHPTIPLEKVDYMINCDMVGRLDETTHGITIGGYGTSPMWGKLLPEKAETLVVKFDSSGVGPSDHTSFYLKNIPVLFFFTGTHADYHKPTDDAYKINFTGEFRVIQYIYNLLRKTEDIPKLVFTKTREPKMETAHFTVSLGFMPDYTFTGTGVRADGIIDGKIAQKIGMEAGDIITALGDYKITDINNYMTALSKFKKGDATTVTILRGKEVKKFNVEF